MNTSSIIQANFTFLYIHKPSYKYQIGEVIREKFLIIDRFFNKKKFYTCKCLKDGYIFTTMEIDLVNGKGCPVCSHNKVVKGINDINTTHPEMVKYFVNIEDTYKYSYSSGQKVEMICPLCGKHKMMTISKLYSNGFSCPYCSDGFSYPNKYTHCLFSQLKSQYIYYKYEWSPDWANLYKYDNYIILPDDTKFIVEIDGGLHYRDEIENNDAIKDRLAEEHGISLIRINCDYNNLTQRALLMQNALTSSLGQIFDLSHIDWSECNIRALSSKVIDTINVYKTKDLNRLRQDIVQEISDEMGLCCDTVRKYLKIGNDAGLCEFKLRKFKPKSI